MYSFEKGFILNFSVFKIFDILKDIERYPDFVKYVKSIEILSDEFEGSGTLYADVSLSLAFCIVSYRCRISFSVPYEVRIEGFASEDFNHVSGKWSLRPIDNDCTEIFFQLEFEFCSAAHQKVAEYILKKRGDLLVNDLKFLCEKKFIK